MTKTLILGNPNSGKTLLFNRLTKLSKKVANFPGVTVELSEGKSSQFEGLSYLDFPGIYTLRPITQDEEVAVGNLDKFLNDDEVQCILYVLDGTRLERSLYLAFQILNKAKEAGKSVVVAANMMDEILNKKQELKIDELSVALGTPVLGISAKSSQGITELETFIHTTSASPNSSLPQKSFEGSMHDLKSKATELAKQTGPQTDVLIKSQNRLDSVFLSSSVGGIIFLAVMAILFQAIFTWASPLMDAIENLIAWASGIVVPLFPKGIAADFMADAIFGGFGSFLVFVPQIFFLSLIIGFLEDSGYLSRAVIICHRPLSFFGLSGKSFVPLLTGHACAIPAIMATRNMESPWRRKLTLLAVPLMGCSARLPVYALFIAALIPSQLYLGGLIGLQGVVFFALFALGIVTALLLTAFATKIAGQSKENTPFVLELPPYRLPALFPLFQKSLQSSWSFIANAGWIIFMVTVVVWILGYFPNGQGALETSFLSYLGRAIEPILSPLGMDWQFGVAILVSFLAREVFVGTLGTMYGIEGADENIGALADQMMANGLTLATGLSVLVFYVIAPQCVSTLAVLKKETGSWKFPTQIFIGFTVLAYVMALITYGMFS